MILCGVSNVFHAVLQNLKLCVCVCVCVCIACPSGSQCCIFIWRIGSSSPGYALPLSVHVVQGSASSVGFCQGGWKGVSRLYMGVGVWSYVQGWCMSHPDLWGVCLLPVPSRLLLDSLIFTIQETFWEIKSCSQKSLFTMTQTRHYIFLIREMFLNCTLAYKVSILV